MTRGRFTWRKATTRVRTFSEGPKFKHPATLWRSFPLVCPHVVARLAFFSGQNGELLVDVRSSDHHCQVLLRVALSKRHKSYKKTCVVFLLVYFSNINSIPGTKLFFERLAKRSLERFYFPPTVASNGT